MAFELERETARRLPLEDVVTRARVRADDFFPSRVASEAIVASESGPQRLRTRLGRGYQVSRAESVEVPKWSGATRPVLDMTVDDRVVYDALVVLVKDSIPAGVVNWSPEQPERLAAELEIANGAWTHVVRTDVNAYYEYVDHQRLEDELLELSGEDEAVTGLVELLGEAQGRASGLPQGPVASKSLADLYLSIVDRSLARRDIPFFRYSDDYRLPATSWRGAVRAQIALEHELRLVGLTVNSAKTLIPTRETFAAWLEDLTVRVHQPRPAPAQMEYTDGEPAPETAPNRRSRIAAEAVVEEIARRPDFWGSSYDQSRRLLDALFILSAGVSVVPTEQAPVLVSAFPHLTKEICRYLRRQMRTQREDRAAESLVAIFSEHRYYFDWQLGWLFHAAIRAQGMLPPHVMREAEEALLDDGLPWFVRGRAAVLLSTENNLALGSEFSSMLAEAPAATRPDLVAAAANCPDSADRARVLGTTRADPLLRAAESLVASTGVLRL